MLVRTRNAAARLPSERDDVRVTARGAGAGWAKGPAPIMAGEWSSGAAHPEHAARTIVYFAHDWADAAVRRRVESFRRDGLRVAGYAMHRDASAPPDWVVADLGRTRDNAYLQRALSIATGAQRALRQSTELVTADLIVARNLDMLATAELARRRAAPSVPLVYECLDIHRFLARDDVLGSLLRRAEARLLADAATVWVSSPAFADRYFRPRHGGSPRVNVIENRMAQAPAPRPGIGARPPELGPLRIGWFGNLRCRRSLALLEAVAVRFPGRVEIALRGFPAPAEIPDFHERVRSRSGMAYGGRYRAPEDLEALYGGVDLVWAGDFMDAGLNSAWLLPNRLYEGGWFGCPPIAPGASETGRWIEERACGFILAEPIERTLPDLVAGLLGDRARIRAARGALLGLPDDTFLEPEGTIAAMVDAAIAAGAGRRTARRASLNAEPPA